MSRYADNIGKEASTGSQQMASISPSHGLIFGETCFFVVHRRIAFGPFDYEWAPDLSGIEFTYQGEKFGEVCSENQFYADLAPFGLPRRVSQVAMVVLGCLMISIDAGEDIERRMARLAENLAYFGLEHFAVSNFL